MHSLTSLAADSVRLLDAKVPAYISPPLDTRDYIVFAVHPFRSDSDRA